ncbi:MAG: ParB/RepB/Spo0J family partition protein [Acidobacteriaceae bacterium]
MSGTVASKPLPLAGRALVIGMAPGTVLQFKYRHWVHFCNYWDIKGESDITPEFRAVLVSKGIDPEDRKRIRELVAKGNGNKPTLTEVDSLPILQERLNALFSGLDLSVPPNGKKPEPKPPAPLPKPAPAEPAPHPFSLAIREEDVEGAVWADTDKIRPFQSQPRKFFSDEKMKELKASIRAIGQQTPIIVKRIDDPHFQYELLDGERRLKACTDLKIKRMLVCIRRVGSAEDQFIASVVANFAREGHTPLETARAIARIRADPRIKELSPGQQIEQIAEIFGRSTVWVYQHLQLLSLHPEIIKMMEADDEGGPEIGISIGIALARVSDAELQLKLCRHIVKNGYGIHQARNYIEHHVDNDDLKRKRKPSDDFKLLDSFLQRLVVSSQMITDMPHHSLEDLFKNRNRDDLDKTIKVIDQGLEALYIIREEIARLKQRGK